MLRGRAVLPILRQEARGHVSGDEYCPDCQERAQVGEVKPGTPFYRYEIRENNHRINFIEIVASDLDAVTLVQFQIGNLEQNPFGPMPAKYFNEFEFHGVITPQPGNAVTLVFESPVHQALSCMVHFGPHPTHPRRRISR